jgi:hypothetical protein
MSKPTMANTAFDVGIEQIARVCHEVNRAYCVSLGDDSQVPWQDAPDWQRTSAMNGVRGHLSGVISSPEQAHEAWLAEKQATGWTYGPVKDPAAKTHPCIRPYADLPVEQRTKDALFGAVVAAFQ